MNSPYTWRLFFRRCQAEADYRRVRNFLREVFQLNDQIAVPPETRRRGIAAQLLLQV